MKVCFIALVAWLSMFAPLLAQDNPSKELPTLSFEPPPAELLDQYDKSLNELCRVGLNPVFPKKWLVRGQEGVAVLEYSIDKNGHIVDYKLVYSNPKVGALSSVTDAIRRYNATTEPLMFESQVIEWTAPLPRVVDGEVSKIEGCVKVIEFRFG